MDRLTLIGGPLDKQFRDRQPGGDYVQFPVTAPLRSFRANDRPDTFETATFAEYTLRKISTPNGIVAFYADPELSDHDALIMVLQGYVR